MEKSDRKVQYLVTLSLSIASLTMGACSGWASPVVDKFHRNQTSIHISLNEVGWVLSLGPPGFVVGSLVAGLIMNRIGRRATILWSALPYLIGMVMVVTSVKSVLFFTMFFWNIGTGILSSVMTVYFGEISDKEIRGTLALVTRITFNFGTLLMMCIGPYLSYTTLNRLLLVLPIIYLAVCWWIPESPYHYLKDGRIEQAKNALAKLKGFKSEAVLNEELLRMKSQVRKEMSHSTSVFELFTGQRYRKAVIIAAGLKITSVMTGAMTITQYLGVIMKDSGINMDVGATLVIFGVIRFIVSVMPSVLVDKVGRRPLLIYSYIGTSISLAIVGFYFFCLEVLQIELDTLRPYGFITLTGIILSNIISTIGFNSLVSLIPGEIFPLNVKAVAFASLGVFAGILGFIVAKSYQHLVDCIYIRLCGVFWIFSTVALIGAVFSMFCVPETKGKSLQEIQMMLQGSLYNDETEIKLSAMGDDAKVDEEEGREMEEFIKK